MPIKPILYELDYFPDPVSVYGSLRNEPYSSFLDSGMDAKKLGRFSFIGYDPFMVVESKGEDIKVLTQDGTETFKDNPFTFLRSVLSYYKTERISGDIPFVSGCVGYFSYDLRYFLEELPRYSQDDIRTPDLVLSFYDVIIIFDNLLKKAYISSSGLPQLDGEKNRDRAKRRLLSAKRRLKDVTSSVFDTFDGAKPRLSGRSLEAPLSITLSKPRALARGTSKGDSREEYTNPDSDASVDIFSNFTRDDYKKAIEKAKDYIREGDIYQVNLSQRLSCSFDGDGFELYKTLRRINPAPFAAYLNLEDFQIVSASPERFIKIRDGHIETRPIKGTRPRGRDEKEDAGLKKELVVSEKDRAEHLMIVDLERNDIGRVCEYGSVSPKEFIIVETYSTVHHLVSTVSGKLKDGVDVIDCLCNCFPGGSITGAPKIRSMEIIEEIEPAKRGIYTGSIGYIDFSGAADFSIVIRTAVIKDSMAYFQVGGGIVADSDPDKEFDETMDKARAIIQAINIEKSGSFASLLG